MRAPPWISPRLGALVGAVLLHLMLLALAAQLRAWPERARPAEAVPLLVRLLDAPAAAPRDPPRPGARPSPAPAAPAMPVRRLDDAPSQAITLPAEDVQALAAAASAPAAAASARPPPLNLELPRGATAPWRQRPPALDDARANTPRLTLEQRIADTLGGDAEWVEEPIDADHRRLRRGNTCIALQRPRAAQLDPFNPANRALPWQAGTPTRCAP